MTDVVDDWDAVTVWLGSFADESRLDAYLHETYADDDSDCPISEFAADQGQSFYDHDLVEAGFVSGVPGVRELVAPHSFSASYLDSVVQRAGVQSLPEPLNTVVLVFGKEITRPKAAHGPGYALACLGEFACNPEMPAAV